MRYIVILSLWYLMYAIGCQVNADGPYTFETCKERMEEIAKQNPVYVYCQREELKDTHYRNGGLLGTRNFHSHLKGRTES